MPALPRDSTTRRFFAGLVEAILQGQLGVPDPPLHDYLTDLLLRFIHMEAVYKIRSLRGQRVMQVADMIAEASQLHVSVRRNACRHIGDFTLFWAGVYPEALREMQSSNKKDHFIDYCSQGKRAYFIASTIPPDDEGDPLDAILGQLSQRFELCAYGLREIRREWERRDEDAPPVLFID